MGFKNLYIVHGNQFVLKFHDTIHGLSFERIRIIHSTYIFLFGGWLVKVSAPEYASDYTSLRMMRSRHHHSAIPELA